MGNIGNSLRLIAESMETIAASVDAIESSIPLPTEPVIPAAVNCYNGIWPTNVLPFPLGYPSNDVETSAMTTLLSYYDRKMAHCPDGTIAIFGDSQVQDMVAFKLGMFVETFGVGGETLRRCFNRLGRGGLITRAGAIGLATGINELANFSYNAPYTHEQIANNIATMHQCLAAKATGKWVIRDILPVDEPVLTVLDSRWAGMNAKIDDVNSRIHSVWSTSSATVRFVSVKAALVDAAGNLADVNHIDGLHLSASGENVVANGWKTEFTAIL